MVLCAKPETNSYEPLRLSVWGVELTGGTESKVKDPKSKKGTPGYLRATISSGKHTIQRGPVKKSPALKVGIPYSMSFRTD